MSAFDEKNRRKVFGVYSGCPCSVKLSGGFSIEDRNFPKEKFNALLNDLTSQWEQSCDTFLAGPRVGSRIQENWNKSVKLPYGKHATVCCVYNQSSGGPRYCKYSLKEE